MLATTIYEQVPSSFHNKLKLRAERIFEGEIPGFSVNSWFEILQAFDSSPVRITSTHKY